MTEDVGLPGSQTLQLRISGRTQVSARKSEDASVRMRDCRAPRGGMHFLLSETLAGATHLLTDLRQQQHPERCATTGLHGPAAPRAPSTRLSGLGWVTG